MRELEYDIVEGEADNEELKDYSRCFKENGTVKDISLLKWFHQKNKRREHAIQYAIDPGNGSLAAIYTYLPIVLKCLDSKVPALQSFDTLTDYRHRGKGLFIKLASSLEKKETGKGNQMVYGFPNENSVGGFVKKLGFTYFGEVPFLIKPLNITYFIKKVLNRHKKQETEDSICSIASPARVMIGQNTTIEKIETFGSDYNEIWKKLDKHVPIGVNRDAEYMNWRYVERPGSNYSKYGYFEDNVLKGVVVFTLTRKHNGLVGYLMELLYDPENTKAGKNLLKFASRNLKKNRADVILAWCYSHSFNYTTYRGTGYYDFPEKFRPQKLGVIVKVLESIYKNEMYKIKNWYLSYSDSDTV